MFILILLILLGFLIELLLISYNIVQYIKNWKNEMYLSCTNDFNFKSKMHFLEERNNIKNEGIQNSNTDCPEVDIGKEKTSIKFIL